MRIRNQANSFLFVLLGLLAMLPAHAQLTIDIIGGGANQVPIAIAPFKSEDLLPQKVTEVVAADLNRSGLFRIVDSGGLSEIPAELAEVQYPVWTARGADALVIGSIAPLPNRVWGVRVCLLHAA